MPYIQRSAAESFQLDWNKAVAWAQSQGIGPSAYMPVYQLDVNRLRNGSFPMSAAERNRAILAAHTPTQVVDQGPTPRHPGSPFAILDNLMATAKGLFTGLIHLPQELWHTADSTVHAIMHPASLEAKTPGATIGNWLSTTLLSFIPGAADLGAVLKQSSPAEGLAYLAEHPITSILDVLPGDYLPKLVRRGVTEDGVLTRALTSMLPAKAGVTAAGDVVENMTVWQRLERAGSRIGPGGAGVGPELSRLGSFTSEAASQNQNLFAWLSDPSARALSGLNETEWEQLTSILDSRKTTGGDAVARAFRDPSVSPKVKDALDKQLKMLRFASEESLFGGDLKAVPGVGEVAGTRTVSGDRHFYSLPAAKSIMKARALRDAAQREAAAGLTTLSRHSQELEHLDAMLPHALGDFRAKVLAARKAAAADVGLLENVTQEIPHFRRGELKSSVPFRRARGIQKLDQVNAVIGEGGLADQMTAQIRRMIAKERWDPDQLDALVTAMRNRLSAWGPKSANAAEVPALAALEESMRAFSEWTKRYRSNARAIDEMIHGTLERARHTQTSQASYYAQKRQTLKARQATERQNLLDTYRKARSRMAGEHASRISQANDVLGFRISEIENRYEAQARDLKPGVVSRTIMPKVNAEVAQARKEASDAVAAAKRDWAAQKTLRRAIYERDRSRLARSHADQRDALAKQASDVKAGTGAVVRELHHWAKSVDGFSQAIFDHPADEYRTAGLALFHKHLLAHEQSADLIAQTERFVGERSKTADRQAALDAIRSTPEYLAELLYFHFQDIFSDPRLDPEVAAQAEAVKADAMHSAFQELQTLISQKGMKVAYIPATTSADIHLTRDSIRPIVSHGIPKPDMVKQRLWDFTPRTHTFALGINKAVVQALQRDATIELVEHYLRPKILTDAEVKDLVGRVAGVGVPGGIGSIEARYADVARDQLRLTRVDPSSLFHGVKLGSWTGKGMWLPTELVNALKQLDRARRPFLQAPTRLFRYSILGLSPRYDAHVLFGGTTMLAFRAGRHAFSPALLRDAWQAVRDGSLPLLAGRSAAEEGLEDTAFRAFHEAGGRRMVNLAVQEHLSVVQHLERAAVKPLHVLKALGDLNLRFTRGVRDMQAAVVYLTALHRAEDAAGKVTVPELDTGAEVAMTKARAMEEAKRAVEKTYGNLGAMSPLERQVFTTILPFYGWQRHIVAYVLSFPFDHPWRAMVLSQMASHASNDVPLAWPIRLQFLFFLGNPMSPGTHTPVDLRSLDPFRTVANYFSLTGVLQSLNPALGVTPITSMIDPTIVYGENQLYPQMTYTAFYGIDVAKPGGSAVTALSQFTPQVAAAQSAFDWLTGVRGMWQSDPHAAARQLLSNLNIPFVSPPVNLRQQAARTEAARYEAAKTAATQAFRTGTFKGIEGFKTVPTPMNPDYTVTPEQLKRVYDLALRANPNLAPVEWLMPRPVPYGF